MATSAAVHEQDVHIVRFTPDDPENPRNWKPWRKLLAWIPLIVLDLTVSGSASGYSPVLSKVTHQFHVSNEVGVLGLTLYTLALGCGPVINAPLAEHFGRRVVYVGCYGLALPWMAAVAVAPNMASFLVFRFFAGFFQSATIANLGGTLADLYEHDQTGPALSLFVAAGTVSSGLGFLAMSFVARAYHWRVVFWALLGICGGIYVVVSVLVCLCGETRHGVILRKRAARLRQQTGNPNYQVPVEYRPQSAGQIFTTTIGRPVRFLWTEPILIFCGMYNTMMFGISFLLNGAFNLVFGKGHRLSVDQVGLCFLGIVGGVIIGTFTNHLFQEQHYQRQVRQAVREGRSHNNKVMNMPEARTFMAKFAAVAFPASLFWFAWTTYSSINPAVPVLATALWGWSFYTLILMTIQYTQDSYMQYAASALASLGLVRNVGSSAFPLFGSYLFEDLGHQWGGSLLAFLALLTVPIPFVLHKYGYKLRLRSRWAGQHMEDADGNDTVEEAVEEKEHGEIVVSDSVAGKSAENELQVDLVERCDGNSGK